MESTNQVVYPSFQEIISDPSSVYLVVVAKDLKLILAVVKKFSPHIVIDLSRHTLKITTVKNTIGFLRTNQYVVVSSANWPENLVLRTTFNAFKLQDFLKKDATDLVLFCFTPDYLHVFKNEEESIILPPASVLVDIPFVPTSQQARIAHGTDPYFNFRINFLSNINFLDSRLSNLTLALV